MAEKKEPKTKSKETAVKEVKRVEEEEETETIVEESSGPKQNGNFVYIGKKGAMAYVLAVVTQFEMGAKKVIVKARGKSISRAVDVAEIVRNRDPSFKVEGIGIATEEVVTQEGRPLKISSIEITLTK
jgi:DNA-binding protein